jgi:hypothetical protein
MGRRLETSVEVTFSKNHACMRAHQRKRARRSSVMSVVASAPLGTCSRIQAKIMGAETRAGDDIEPVFGKARHGQVRFDAAAGVEQLRVGQPADRLADIIGADVTERRQRVGAADLVLGKRRLIENADLFADMAMLFADGVKPVLAAHRGDVAWLHAFGSKPVGPLPPEFRAKHRTVDLRRSYKGETMRGRPLSYSTWGKPIS